MSRNIIYSVFIGIIIIVVGAMWYGSSELIVAENPIAIAEIEEAVLDIEDTLRQAEVVIRTNTLNTATARTSQDRIETAINSIQRQQQQLAQSSLTPHERSELQKSLQRLQVLLVTFRDTLTTLETVAEDKPSVTTIETVSDLERNFERTIAELAEITDTNITTPIDQNVIEPSDATDEIFEPVPASAPDPTVTTDETDTSATDEEMPDEEDDTELQN